MTEEKLRELEANANREDIPLLVAYIRHLQSIIQGCRNLLK